MKHDIGAEPPVKIHIIEDEEDIARLLHFNLSLDGYDVSCSRSGEQGMKSVEESSPDLVLLDLMLPGIDGLSLCEYFKKKKETAKIPIIMVTAKGEEHDVVKGLEIGADDYITKPFSLKVLRARVKTVIKRAQDSLDSNIKIIKIGDLSIHVGRHEVSIAKEKIDLTALEFHILYFLAQKPGWVFTRSQIINATHGLNHAVTDRSIDFQLVGLRKKLGQASDYIETVRGIGYRMKEYIGA